LVDCLFNGTSTQKGHFVPTAGGGKLAQSAKDGQQDAMHIALRYNVTRFTVKHYSYINTTTGYLIE